MEIEKWEKIYIKNLRDYTIKEMRTEEWKTKRQQAFNKLTQEDMDALGLNQTSDD